MAEKMQIYKSMQDFKYSDNCNWGRKKKSIGGEKYNDLRLSFK